MLKFKHEHPKFSLQKEQVESLNLHVNSWEYIRLCWGESLDFILYSLK